MATITLDLLFSNGSDTCTDRIELDLEPGITDCIEEEVENRARGVGWHFVDWTYVTDDSEWTGWCDFEDLESYAEYIEKCEEHGEAYNLRYQDIGENNMDEYRGCWDCEEDFASYYIGDVPVHLSSYIDWEKWTRDFMMDHSAYQGDKGVHIFSD